jgi:hypothetical protein
VWGNAQYAFLPAAGLVSSDQQQLKQNIGIGSATYRPAQKLSLTGEVEGASSSGVYFRTSLYNDQKVRALVHYQPLQTLSISGDFMLLDNQNPLAGTNFKYTSHQESLVVLLVAPKQQNVRHPGLLHAWRSGFEHRVPGAGRSVAADFALRRRFHTGTALMDLAWPHGKRFTPKLSAGGSFFISSGSRPTSYYQPIVKFWVPLGKHVSWFSNWEYYGLRIRRSVLSPRRIPDESGDDGS